MAMKVGGVKRLAQGNGVSRSPPPRRDPAQDAASSAYYPGDVPDTLHDRRKARSASYRSGPHRSALRVVGRRCRSARSRRGGDVVVGRIARRTHRLLQHGRGRVQAGDLQFFRDPILSQRRPQATGADDCQGQVAGAGDGLLHRTVERQEVNSASTQRLRAIPIGKAPLEAGLVSRRIRGSQSASMSRPSYHGGTACRLRASATATP